MNKRVKIILKSTVLIGVVVVLYWSTFTLPESPFDHELSLDLVDTQDWILETYEFSSIQIYRSVYKRHPPWLALEALEKLPVVYKTSDENEIREFIDSMREISYVMFNTAGKKRELLYVLITMKDGRKAFYKGMPYSELGMIDVSMFPRPDKWWSVSEGYSSVELYKFLMKPGRLG